MNCFGSHRLEEVEAARVGNISGFVVVVSYLAPLTHCFVGHLSL